VTGSEYANLIASYITRNFAARGLEIYREVFLGKTIIGKNRRIDIQALERSSSRALAIECKFQDKLGTVDEKIPYAIEDLRAMNMPVCLVYAGEGFSEGVLHMLAACPIAASCLPEPGLARSKDTRELDVAIAMAFHWWDLVVEDKQPFVGDEA
jgi:hypothetical protein